MVENETLEIDIIETALPVKRQRKKKKMADELANDEDPVNFKTIVEKALEDEALEGIMKLFPQSSKYQIKLELFSFSSNFDVLKLLLNNGENLMDSSCNNCKTCSTCPSCVLKILASNILHDKAYDNLYELYKVVCTLSVTQVHCERTFSKLKIIKDRLRNSMSEENLESYVSLFIEKELLDNLDGEKIIDRFAETSSELKRLLTCS
ncbi:hypothetical protein AVEN_42317-1 [Araneus ventricosus]|uniref:HAT C-terminal dimerisation domain-containing protein n=1 Tax=Araneus ventricosus TaxID=182803 RepID=A0A4Y2TNQ3_ARAVE|nr:hypothetical protein AVEN_42317-1 [Araneus ventricosus]